MIIFVLILLFQVVQIVLTVQIVRILGRKQLSVNVPVSRPRTASSSDDSRLDAVIAALEDAGIKLNK